MRHKWASALKCLAPWLAREKYSVNIDCYNMDYPSEPCGGALPSHFRGQGHGGKLGDSLQTAGTQHKVLFAHIPAFILQVFVEHLLCARGFCMEKDQVPALMEPTVWCR